VGEDQASARAFNLRRRSSAAALVEAPTPVRPIRTAMVLCAGLGTRLRPLTLQYPKPAVPFFAGPLIRYSLALLANAGVERVVINTHHLPGVMEATAREEARSIGLELAVSHEPVIQGTAGGLRDARRLLGDEPLLLVNGDAFISVDLKALIGTHQARGDAATLAVAPMPPHERFGAVETTSDLAVRRIGAPTGGGLTPWHFIGVHVLEPEVFDFIPPAGELDINHLVYPAMVAAGRPVRACPVALGAWADMGTPGRYLQACEQLMSGLCDLSPLGAHAPISDDDARRLREAGIARRVWRDPSARVAEDARLERAVIGPDAVVEGGAQVRRAAVLPDTRVRTAEVVEDAVASGELRLRADGT
jgi:mannose-1-phosphate guanylyltransferase